MTKLCCLLCPWQIHYHPEVQIFRHFNDILSSRLLIQDSLEREKSLLTCGRRRKGTGYIGASSRARKRQVLAYHNSSSVPFPVKRIPIQARAPGGRKNLHLSGDFASGTQVRFTGTPLRSTWLQSSHKMLVQNLVR